MTKLDRYYRCINILSLDIVAGAVISALFFANLFNVSILPYGLISLALTVWCIYTADHLRDAKNIRDTASTYRHRFHQKYFKVMLVALILAVLVDVAMVFFIRKQVLYAGLFLSALVLIYLFVQKFLRFLKEIVIAILYTCGVTLLSISVTQVEIDLVYIVLIVVFALLALINLLMFSWFDREQDRRDLQPSFVQLFGEKVTAKCIYMLIGLCYCLVLIMFIASTLKFAFVILFLMNSLLLLIFVCRDTLAVDERYRYFGDLVFILPMIYLLQ